MPRNLELVAFSLGTVNIVVFDHLRGADQCRSYAYKYCGKAEPHYYLEASDPGGEANPVKRFLLSRNMGLCSCHNRILGFHVVRSTKATAFLWPQFVVPARFRIRRLLILAVRYLTLSVERVFSKPRGG